MLVRVQPLLFSSMIPTLETSSVLTAATCLALIVSAQQPSLPYLMPDAQFERYRNYANHNGEGSCVWMSMGMAGSHSHVVAGEYMPFESEYGRKENGGAGPQDVARACAERGISAYNIEGSATVQWVEWALRTGRYAAISYGRAHMIAAVGISPDGATFYIRDNNRPSVTQAVRRDEFIRQLRLYTGGWAVVYDAPPPPPWSRPAITQYWNR